MDEIRLKILSINEITRNKIISIMKSKETCFLVSFFNRDFAEKVLKEIEFLIQIKWSILRRTDSFKRVVVQCAMFK